MKKTFEEKSESVVLLLCLGASLFVAGYLVGRFTAISDLQKGYLNCFIPKN